MSLFFKGQTFPVTPKPNGAYVNGKWTPGAAGTPFTISGTLHNAPDLVLQTLPEGKRDRGAQMLVTDADLAITDPVANTVGDIVTIDGADWQVESRTKWDNGVIRSREYLVVRVKEGT